MRRVALPILLGLLLSIATAGVALAVDWVAGDGYRFRLPDQFVQADLSDLEGQKDADQVLDLMKGMLRSANVDADVQLFLRQRGSRPDALLFVSAKHFEGERKEAVRNQLSLAHVEAQMLQAKAELEKRSAPLTIARVRRILVSASRPALEVEMSVDDPTYGDLDTGRLLFVIEEGTVCTLSYLGTAAHSAEDGMLWRAIVTSFRLEERGSMMQMLVRYGPFILGGLIMLIAILALRRSSTPKRIQLVHTGGLDGESTGFSRALDGLPTYGDESAEAPEPAFAGAAAGGGMGGMGMGMGTGMAESAFGRPRGGPGAAPPVPRKIARATPAEPDAGAAPGGAPPRPPPVAAAPTEPRPRPIPRAAPASPPRPSQPVRSPFQAEPEEGVRSPFQAEPAEAVHAFREPSLAPPPPSPAPSRPSMEVDESSLEGADLPTNVAMRSARPGADAPVPEAASAEEVLSRLMGLDGPPAPPTQVPTQRRLAKAPPEPGEGEGLKIQRNSDFYEEQ